MKFNKRLAALAVSTALMVPVAAQATNGMFPHGYGAISKAMAGATVALSQDAISPTLNPAGLVGVGSRLDVGYGLFMPSRSFDTGGPVVDSDGSDMFVVPHVGYSSMIDDSSAWGFAMVGNGGMNTHYSDIGAGINLSQLGMVFTYSRALNANHSVGISPIYVYQMFNSYGGFSDNGNDEVNTSTGFGARIGWEGKVMPSLTLAAAYQPKIAMSEFSDYQGLFGGHPTNGNGSLDIPANYSVGVAYGVNEKLTVTADYQTTQYSDVDVVGSNGLTDGYGFGWSDMDVIKVGVQYQASESMTYRFGFSNGENPLDSDLIAFSGFMAPATIETHIAAGLTKTFSGGDELSFAMTSAMGNKVDGTGPSTGTSTEMSQMDIEMTFSKKF